MSPEHGPEGVDIIEIIISSLFALRDMILFWHLKLVMLVPLSEIFMKPTRLFWLLKSRPRCNSRDKLLSVEDFYDCLMRPADRESERPMEHKSKTFSVAFVGEEIKSSFVLPLTPARLVEWSSSAKAKHN